MTARRIPRWARCLNCNGDLYLRTCYPTDEGYVHTFCSPASRVAKAARIEDLTWLAACGVGMTEAARRCGWESANSLDKWLRKRAPELVATFIRNEPRDWNKALGGEAIFPDPSHKRARSAA